MNQLKLNTNELYSYPHKGITDLQLKENTERKVLSSECYRSELFVLLASDTY